MISKGTIAVAVAGLAVAGTLAACGGSSAPAPAVSPSASVTATGLARFRSVATGPLADRVQADAVRLTRDAGNPKAAEADARLLAGDLSAWADALRAVEVPAGAQATKDKLLKGLGQMRTGVTEYADGLRTGSSSLVTKGQADVQAGVSTISQASGQVR